MWARTDLWEAWVGNHPGRPGPTSFGVVHSVTHRSAQEIVVGRVKLLR